MLIITAAASAQSLMPSFAVRGGGNMYLTNGNPTSQMGYQAMFDLGYSMYSRFNQMEMGFKTGISVGYATANFSKDYHRTFTNTDYLGFDWQYTVDAHNITLSSQQVVIEVPVMFALRTYTWFLNIGAKFMTPVLYNTYTQTINDYTIDAYFERTDVHVINQLITGKITEPKKTGNNCLPKYNILFGFETGREWTLENKDRIGLGVYFDIAPWCSKAPGSSSSGYLIDVAPITDPINPPAVVTVNLLSCEMERMMMMDFGIKLYYGINYLNKAALGLHW